MSLRLHVLSMNDTVVDAFVLLWHPLAETTVATQDESPKTIDVKCLMHKIIIINPTQSCHKMCLLGQLNQ